MNYTLEVLVNGRRVKEYAKDGLKYIEARKGTEYSLQLKNHSHKRIRAIFSVDGIDVIGGGEARKAQSGYIVDAYDSIEIKGYRINDSEVARFKFGDKRNSYAKEISGTSKDCGVIGVKINPEITQPRQPIIIKEKEYVPYYPWNDPWNHPWKRPWYPYYGDPPIYSSGEYRGAISGISCCNAMSCVSSSNSNEEFNVGTQWGEAVTDKVKTVEFQASSEETILEIFYTDRKGLEKLGIDFEKAKKIIRPQAFGYCKIPNGWAKQGVS